MCDFFWVTWYDLNMFETLIQDSSKNFALLALACSTDRPGQYPGTPKFRGTRGSLIPREGVPRYRFLHEAKINKAELDFAELFEI